MKKQCTNRITNSRHAWIGSRPHQTLAIARGEKEGVLRVHVDVPERDWLDAIQSEFEQDILSPFADQLALAIQDSAERLLLPSIERDVRREKGETADSHAIQVFANNLRALLSQPPLAQHIIMGIDPGFRTGCKVAVIDCHRQIAGYRHDLSPRAKE